MATTTSNTYCDVYFTDGSIKRLPMSPNATCSDRPTVEAITDQTITLLVNNLPTPPSGFKWQSKNCSFISPAQLGGYSLGEILQGGDTGTEQENQSV